MAFFTRENLIDALTRLGQIAVADGQSVELLIVGGGIMVMDLGTRDSTRDLDGVIINSLDPARIRQYAQSVATERGWPHDWLNDGAKGFLVGPTAHTNIFESAGITVSRPAYEQLLAMKLCAWRDDVDISDARRLLNELPDNREKAWTLVQPFLQPGKLLKAKYAFDDLWENKS